jgi:hypothetical protein
LFSITIITMMVMQEGVGGVRSIIELLASSLLFVFGSSLCDSLVAVGVRV